MGWLDHSTNNIILDAVLTDYGRQRLATANSAFKISSYALGDDEVDYRLVKRYGRTVGKEKIEKNTPIFEALTNPSIALKYRLVGSTTFSSVYIPYLEAAPSSIDLLKEGGTNPSKQVIITPKYSSSMTNFSQTTYRIKVSGRFFTISGTGVGTNSTAEAGDPNRTTVYTLNNVTTQTFAFTVAAKSIDSTTLSVYGKRTSSPGKRQITSVITVVGETYGSTLDIPVTYTATL